MGGYRQRVFYSFISKTHKSRHCMRLFINLRLLFLLVKESRALGLLGCGVTRSGFIVMRCTMSIAEAGEKVHLRQEKHNRL